MAVKTRTFPRGKTKRNRTVPLEEGLGIITLAGRRRTCIITY